MAALTVDLLVDELKTHEQNVIACIDALSSFDSTDLQWLAIARTNIKQGFMAVTRSVAEH